MIEQCEIGIVPPKHVYVTFPQSNYGTSQQGVNGVPKKGALGPNLGTMGAKLVTFYYSNAMVTIWAALFEPIGTDFILGANFGR